MKMTDRTFVLLLLAPATVFLAIFVAYPLFSLVYNSFFEVELFTPDERIFVGLQNFIDAINSSRVQDTALRTLKFTGIALSIELLLGFGIALLFNSLGKRSQIFRTIFMFPLMIPPIVAGLLWRFLLIDNIGILNYILADLGIIGSPSDLAWLSNTDIVLFSVALPDIWLTTSFVTLVLFTGLQNIPTELIEAAKIDGANAIQRFRNITLPLLRPVLAVVLIIRGIDAARTFDIIWIQTEGGPRNASEVLSMYIYRVMVRFGDLGRASAIATLFMIGMLIISVLAFRWIWGRGTSQA